MGMRHTHATAHTRSATAPQTNLNLVIRCRNTQAEVDELLLACYELGLARCDEE